MNTQLCTPEGHAAFTVAPVANPFTVQFQGLVTKPSVAVSFGPLVEETPAEIIEAPSSKPATKRVSWTPYKYPAAPSIHVPPAPQCPKTPVPQVAPSTPEEGLVQLGFFTRPSDIITHHGWVTPEPWTPWPVFVPPSPPQSIPATPDHTLEVTPQTTPEALAETAEIEVLDLAPYQVIHVPPRKPAVDPRHVGSYWTRPNSPRHAPRMIGVRRLAALAASPIRVLGIRGGVA